MKKDFIEMVKRTLDKAKAKELIDEDIHKILFRSIPRTSNLYLLPKIHKANNPGRPIINSAGNLTETLLAFVESRAMSKTLHISFNSPKNSELRQRISLHSRCYSSLYKHPPQRWYKKSP